MDEFLREWPVISGAPAIVAALVVGITTVVFGIVWFLFKERLASLHARLQLRDDQLERVQLVARRVDAAAEDPSGLRQELAALKAVVAQQTPRVLTTQQKQILVEALRAEQPTRLLNLCVDPYDFEGRRYAKQFEDTLSSIHWSALVSPFPLAKDFSGLALRVRDSEAPSRQARRLSKALTEAGILHVVRSTGNPKTPDDYMDIVFGRRGEFTSAFDR